MNNLLVTQKFVKERYKYDLLTGFLVWKEDGNNQFMKKDYRVGHKAKDEYRYVVIKKRQYMEHRIIWLYVYGYFPENDIDHINGIKDDNRIKNLREVSRSCNIKNVFLTSKNKLGVRGVYWHKRDKVFCSQISNKMQKKLYLGSYQNFDDAVISRYEAEIEHDYFDCLIKSSAYLYLKENNLI